MNGRCSDDSTDQLIQQPQHHSLNNSDYTVSPLPASPPVTDYPNTLTANGYLHQQRPGTNDFVRSSGGTLSKELEQHPYITSTQETERNGKYS